MTGWLPQNEWITPAQRQACRWCSEAECEGACVSATQGFIEVDLSVDGKPGIERVYESGAIPAIGTPYAGKPLKVKSAHVWQWPEWQALAARLGIKDLHRVTDCVVRLSRGDVARVEVNYIATDTQPCPPHQSDTAPSASQQEQQGETTPTAATSGDTPRTGTDAPTCG